MPFSTNDTANIKTHCARYLHNKKKVSKFFNLPTLLLDMTES
jgi:hypothetical protein